MVKNKLLNFSILLILLLLGKTGHLNGQYYHRIKFHLNGGYDVIISNPEKQYPLYSLLNFIEDGKNFSMSVSYAILNNDLYGGLGYSSSEYDNNIYKIHLNTNSAELFFSYYPFEKKALWEPFLRIGFLYNKVNFLTQPYSYSIDTFYWFNEEDYPDVEYLAVQISHHPGPHTGYYPGIKLSIGNEFLLTDKIGLFADFNYRYIFSEDMSGINDDMMVYQINAGIYLRMNKNKFPYCL